jgi:hypothetical protein
MRQNLRALRKFQLKGIPRWRAGELLGELGTKLSLWLMGHIPFSPGIA